MTDYLFVKIALSCAVIGWCWVDVLTPDRAIFDFVKAYYPLRLENPLNCAHCFSGWLSFFVLINYYIYSYNLCNYFDLLYIVLMPMFTMAFVQVLKTKG